MGGTHRGPEPGWGGAVFPGLTGAVPHHLTVDGTADTVVQLHVQLGQDISCRVDNTGTDEDTLILRTITFTQFGVCEVHR